MSYEYHDEYTKTAEPRGCDSLHTSPANESIERPSDGDDGEDSTVGLSFENGQAAQAIKEP